MRDYNREAGAHNKKGVIALLKSPHLLCCLVFFLLTGCMRLEPPETSGELLVAVREAPGFFQRDGDAASGSEYDLVSMFAASIGVRVRFIIAKDLSQLSTLLAARKVHMAASMPESGFKPAGSGHFLFSTPIRSVGQWIVGHDDALGPDEMAELSGRTVAVVAGSPLAAALRALDGKSRPLVVEVPDVDEMELLARVAARTIPLAAVHEINFNLASNFYPELNARLRLPGKTDLGWAFSGNSNDAGSEKLRAQANAFIARARADGALARINDRYFGHITRIDSAGIAQFIKDTSTRLPALRRHFYAAQDLTGIDWRLIAALAYQESHWDPLATSPTNVRGIMMLTEETADHLGVENRLDPASSIRAGARYLAELGDQLPDSAKPPDRLWLALASYNLGMGHFRGAQAIARRMKRDPDSWYEMKQVLPLLARPEVYAHLKAGPARGGEAVILVENVRTYYNILARFEPAHITPFARPAPQAAGQVRLR